MPWIHLIILFSLIQLFVITLVVGKARGRFQVPAPATTGNENFERYYRAQMNTIELLVMFIPSILVAAMYFSPYLMAVLGLIYVIGRVIYFKAYVSGANRFIGFMMSLAPIMIFLILGIIGTVRALIYA